MAETKSADDIFRSAAIGKNDPKTGSFNIIRYPMDLAFNQYPHYVMFFVNVRVSDISDMQNSPAVSNVKMDNTKMNRPNTEGQGTMVGMIAGGVAGVAVGKEAGKLVDQVGGGAGGAALRLGAAGALLGAAGGAVLANAVDRSQVLLKDVIALYMAGKPIASYSASWGEEELGLMGAFADSSNPLGSLEGIGGMGASLLMKGAESNGSKIFGNAGKALEGTLAMTPNPFKAQLFKAMKFRTFAYDYSFLPKDDVEYLAVRQIINMFKRYMHPSLGGGKAILKYPAEFSICYYYKGAPNPELFRISNCALTDMSVEYGGSDFTTFRDMSGAPTEITMKLKFTELEMMTQERFGERGF
jgi:hypothetical protein